MEGSTAKLCAAGLAILLVALSGLTSMTWAAPKRSRAIDLRASASTRIDGAAAGDRSGVSVASAGDVNGDGRGDLIIGAPLADNNARKDSGSAYVVFGPLGTPVVDLGALGAGGFRIDGGSADDRAGLVVDGAGDVNGDGLADLLVAAPAGGRDRGGSARGWGTFVVFGKQSPTTVDLGALGTAGYKIDGAGYSDTENRIAAGAGDVNGDGLADTIVGVPFAADRPYPNATYEGGAYVVFGSSSSGTVDLASLGARGFFMAGTPDREDEGEGLYRTGLSVDGVGDMNGDRRSDVVVGSTIGATYVVFGKATTDTVVLRSLAGKGFGIADDDFGTASSAVAGAGDVNADGRSDLIVSSSELEVGFNSYVVFGKPTGGLVRLDSLRRSRRGFTLVSSRSDTGSDHDVAAAGDVNGDGRSDVISSAILHSRKGTKGSGSSYVVFGRRSSRPAKLDKLGPAGMRLAGAWTKHPTPFMRVAGVSDLVADGRPDVVVTDYLSDNNGRSDSGSTYVVSGASIVANAR